MLPRLIDERVLKDPTYTRRIGPNDGVDSLGQHSPNGVQVLNDPRASPVNVGSILENDIDERFTEHRLTANELHLRRRDEPGGNRIGDLIFDEIRGPALPLCINYHLHVAQVRNRIQRCARQRPDRTCDTEHSEDDYEERIASARLYDSLEEKGLCRTFRTGTRLP